MTQTIDYGIDLGTTNSTIARLDGTNIEVFRNNEGFEYMPSAVWLDKHAHLITGRIAKEWCEREPENAYSEFKRDMGSRKEYLFSRSGRNMTPEELSAEVLKSLRQIVQKRNGELVESAVITVPAEFTLAASEATKNAARLAGIQHCLLLSEPVAAAQAYGFEREENNSFWLVYDFGGGTFDAAIIKIREGIIKVEGCGGDDKLGGKNIDWAIVEQLLIPAVVKERPLTNFGRNNTKWRGAIAKLKSEAEKAKIQLSTNESYEIQIDFLCNDDRNEPVEFHFDLHRSELERLADPFIRQSINLCKETLHSRGLSPSAISKVLLVGGPTLMPYLRKQLSDPKEGLGIPLEFNIDPLTVVARGAAIFAGTQKLPDDPDWRKKVPVGQFGIKLDYESLESETERPVSGIVSSGNGDVENFSGYTVEFINPDIRPEWRSGKIRLGLLGNFTSIVMLEKDKANDIRLELYNADGTLQQMEPNCFRMTSKGSGTVQITLEHAVGVPLVSNEIAICLEKGITLPAVSKVDLQTIKPLERGKDGMLLRVPVIQGDKTRADRNRLIGTLEINAQNIERDVPSGSPIEVSLEIDKSRQILVKAYIPILGEENGLFNKVLMLEHPIPKAEELLESLKKTKERLLSVREQADQTKEPEAVAAIRKIDSECLVAEAEFLASAASEDSDAAQNCEKHLTRLALALDDAEDALEWETLVVDTKTSLEQTRDMVKNSTFTTDDDKERFAVLEREIHEAIDHHSSDLLRRRLADLKSLNANIDARDPALWVSLFEYVKEKKAEMTDQTMADMLFNMGERAISNSDINSLETAVRELIRLLRVVPPSFTPFNTDLDKRHK